MRTHFTKEDTFWWKISILCNVGYMNLIFGQGTKIPHAAEQLIPGITATEPHTLDSMHNSQLERVCALQQKIPHGASETLHAATKTWRSQTQNNNWKKKFLNRRYCYTRIRLERNYEAKWWWGGKSARTLEHYRWECSSHLKNKSAVLYKPKHIPKASLVVQSVKSLPGMQKTRVRFLGRDDPLEKEMAAHSNILAWWAMVHGFARVRHDLVTKPPPPPNTSPSYDPAIPLLGMYPREMKHGHTKACMRMLIAYQQILETTQMCFS